MTVIAASVMVHLTLPYIMHGWLWSVNMGEPSTRAQPTVHRALQLY